MAQAQLAKPRKTRPIPIRVDNRLAARIRKAAKRMGSSSSAVVRFSILQQLPDIESGHITLIGAGK